jgi:hypothetical protein
VGAACVLGGIFIHVTNFFAETLWLGKGDKRVPDGGWNTWVTGVCRPTTSSEVPDKPAPVLNAKPNQAPMNKVLSVGLDVHKESVVAAPALQGDSEVQLHGEIRGTLDALDKVIKKLPQPHLENFPPCGPRIPDVCPGF